MNRFVVSAILLISANALLIGADHRARYEVTERRLSALPTTVAGYIGEEHRYSTDVYRVLETDDSLLRRYQRPDGTFQWLFVGYFGTEKGGRTGHTPQYCLPGSGYRIVGQGQESVVVDSRPTQVNAMVAQNGSEKIAVLYWFQSGSKVMGDGWSMNIRRLVQRLHQRRDDGAFVRITSPVTGSIAETLDRQRTFAAAVIKDLSECWPVETAAADEMSQHRLGKFL